MTFSKWTATAAIPILSFALVLSVGTRAFAFQATDVMPKAVPQAIDKGAVNPEEEMNLTVHLKMNNKAAFDKAVEELYNPSSPTYQHWMTDAELQSYAPSARSMAVVKAELEKNGLTVLSEDPMGFSIRVHGTAANVQKAFQTEIREYTLKTKTFRAHTQAARLTGGADSLVEMVGGLNGSKVHPLLKRVVDAKTGKAPAAIPLGKVKAGGGVLGTITDNCFSPPKGFTFTTPGAALPVGNFYGNDYSDSKLVCTFTPAQLQAHYGLTAAYAQGFDGTGETIVLMEAYGYPTIQADANTFSSLAGLPALTSANFAIIYPEGLPKNPNAGVELGWDAEIALDVQWAHSIAPKAKILVVAAAGQAGDDFQFCINYVVTHHLGNVISNSWEEDNEQFAGVAEVDSYNRVLKKAAAQGISVNFSTGDAGDEGNGSPIGAPNLPSDSPWATAVGGTSILHNFNGSTVETGWGDTFTLLNSSGVVDPPESISQYFGGGGGGESIFFKKPSWQAALPGTGRQLPDVSALADPYTGVFIVLTQSGSQYFIPGYGGTSLSCPIFSAFWAIANQYAGHPLGQAAPTIAKLNSNQIIDIVSQGSNSNVAGTIFDSYGATAYLPYMLVSDGVNPVPSDFISAFLPFTNTDYVISFGYDTSLTVTTGWDNVTGFGVPNGLPFIKGAGK